VRERMAAGEMAFKVCPGIQLLRAESVPSELELKEDSEPRPMHVRVIQLSR